MYLLYLLKICLVIFVGNVVLPMACNSCNSGKQQKDENNQAGDHLGRQRPFLFVYFQRKCVRFGTNRSAGETSCTFIRTNACFAVYQYVGGTSFRTGSTIRTGIRIAGNLCRTEKTQKLENGFLSS